MSNIFEAITEKVRGSYFIIWVAIVSMMGLVLGAIFFYQDTVSSRWGYEMLERHFALTTAVLPLVYWAMSLAPQVGQILFGYAYLGDPEGRLWAGVAAAVFFGIDIVSDVYYITNGQPTLVSALVASGLSVLFFTVGCEAFIAFGFGLFLETLAPAVIQLRRAGIEIGRAFGSQPRTRQPENRFRQEGRTQ